MFSFSHRMHWIIGILMIFAGLLGLELVMFCVYKSDRKRIDQQQVKYYSETMRISQKFTLHCWTALMVSAWCSPGNPELERLGLNCSLRHNFFLIANSTHCVQTEGLVQNENGTEIKTDWLDKIMITTLHFSATQSLKSSKHVHFSLKRFQWQRHLCKNNRWHLTVILKHQMSALLHHQRRTGRIQIFYPRPTGRIQIFYHRPTRKWWRLFLLR